jgi:hypothetical protein
MSNQTPLEKELDRKFQMLSNGKPCDCCMAEWSADAEEEPKYQNATGEKWPKFRTLHLQGHVSAATAAHHIIHRTNKTTRWDWRNALAVCQECHTRIHNEPGFNKWTEAVVIGTPRMDFLKARANIDHKKALINLGQTEEEWQKIIQMELDEQLDNKIRYLCSSADIPF